MSVIGYYSMEIMELTVYLMLHVYYYAVLPCHIFLKQMTTIKG